MEQNRTSSRAVVSSSSLLGATTAPFCLILLSRGFSAKVSPSDYGRVSQFKWSAVPQSHTCYAHRRDGQTWITLHRFILGAVKGQTVDHADRDGLNNTRENIRFCTYAQNVANSVRKANPKTPFRGVAAYRKHFRARIMFAGRNYYLGGFPTSEEAALAYDAKARELYGSFAHTNFPEIA